MNISIEPLSRTIGAEIKGLDLTRPIDESTRKEILDAFHRHIALLFRGQELTAEDQVRFATTFGDLGKRTLGPRLRKSADDIYNESVMLVTNIMENGKPPKGAAAFGEGEMWFHHDTCFYEIPNIATILYGIEVSSDGGLTRIANMYEAYKKIPRDLRNLLEGRTVHQIYDYQRCRVDPNVDLSGARHHLQPIFITHPVTGKRALYVNRMMTARITGMDRGESEAILDTLFAISEDEKIIYEHAWRAGDLLMWDNRCSMHARTDFPNEQRRLLRRCTVSGKEPMRP